MIACLQCLRKITRITALKLYINVSGGCTNIGASSFYFPLLMDVTISAITNQVNAKTMIPSIISILLIFSLFYISDESIVQGT